MVLQPRYPEVNARTSGSSLAHQGGRELPGLRYLAAVPQDPAEVTMESRGLCRTLPAVDVFTSVLPVVTLMLGAWMNQLSEAKRPPRRCPNQALSSGRCRSWPACNRSSSKLGWASPGTPEELGDLVVKSHNHLAAAQEALASRLRAIYGV